MSTTLTPEQQVTSTRASRRKRAMVAVAAVAVLGGAAVTVGTSGATVNDSRMISGTLETGTVSLTVNGAAESAAVTGFDEWAYAPGATPGSDPITVANAGSLNGALTVTPHLSGDLAPYVTEISVYANDLRRVIPQDSTGAFNTLDAGDETDLTVSVKIADDPAAQGKSLSVDLDLVLTAGDTWKG